MNIAKKYGMMKLKISELIIANKLNSPLILDINKIDIKTQIKLVNIFFRITELKLKLLA